MNGESSSHGSGINPHLFGPLSDEPLVEDGSSELFLGEKRLLSKSVIRKKRALRDTLRATLDRILAEGEQVVYLLPAQQQPRLLELFGLGFWFIHLHHVALLLTDHRLIEILMDLRGNTPSTRIRSYPWGGARSLKLRLGKLTVTTISGEKQAWRLRVRADRKVLKQLVPKIEKRISELTGTVPESEAHYWHCPSCGNRVAPNPGSCGHCGTRFRTPKMATVLSLAFPGAGLFYAQRPVLGTLDLIGEVVLFLGLLTMVMVSSGPEQSAISLAFGGLLIFLTKLESIHVSGILVRRTRAVTERAEGAWKKLAYGGGVLSVAALALAVAATGSMSLSLSRDLEFDAEDLGWRGTRTASEFNANDDGTQRSQWYNAQTDLEVAVSAFIQDPWMDLEGFRGDYLTFLTEGGDNLTMVDDALPGRLSGFCSILSYEAFEWTELSCIVWDEESNAVHQVLTSVPAEMHDETLTAVRALMKRATWIPAIEPTS
jgi:hypothetical protein